MAMQQNQHSERQQQQEQEQIEVIEQIKPVAKNQCFFYIGDLQNSKKVLAFFEGIHYSIFISVITLITLFADDFRVIFFTATQDYSFNFITIICMAFYFVQIVVLCFVKESYFFGFYFWLDVISTGTMILDLTWIKQLMTGNNGAVQSAATVAKVARASRASKIGAQATKLVRIVRLIRFLKLYKTASKQLAKDNHFGLQRQKRIINQPFSKQSKLSTGQIDSKVTNKRWSRIKQGSSCKMIPINRSHNEISLINVLQGSAHKLAMNQISQKLGGRSSILHIQHLTNINHNHPINNQDGIIQSNHKIDSHQKGKKRHNTENIKDLVGFQGYFREFQYSGSRENQSIQNIGQSQSQIEIPNETRVGKKVKDEIQKNIILMIILIIISIPLFNASTWYSSNITSYEKGIYQLELAAQTSSALYDNMDISYIDFMMKLPSTLVYFYVNVNTTCCTFPDNYSTQRTAYNVSNSEEYRTGDLLSFITDAGSQVVFQSTSTSALTSKLNIGRTIFVCLILIISTLLFSRDIQIYALQPLQNMFETVGKIAINPLGAIREIQEKKMYIQAMQQDLVVSKAQLTQPNILQNLIVKIGSLLAVGFGQAGTEIISKVIQDPQFVNVIIPGLKVMGVYGFCDIRNFTDATEILQADVMVFVNQIAQICHSIVNSHCGSPNKNIGDAFLLVWKYKQADTKFEQINGESKTLQLVETRRVKQLADLAVLSFVRMIADISRSYTLLKYKNNKALQKRIKDYKGVKMGFGLHVGWSIQGPIGSEFKVDASYLSPSVNMAGRLEAGTKEYGVPMLITEDVYKLMTENRKHLRLIDRVMFEGNAEPTNLYTVDLHIDSLLDKLGVHRQPTKTHRQKKLQKIKQNIKRNKLLEDIEIKFVTKQLWDHKDIRIMRERYTLGFYQEWEKGFDAYIRGQWDTALTVFKRTQIMAPDHKDGPSQALQQFIQSYNGVAPQDWKGYREATI